MTRQTCLSAFYLLSQIFNLSHSLQKQTEMGLHKLKILIW